MVDNNTRPPFAVFDIDGTVIRWQLYHAIVTELAHKGCLSTKAEAIIARARLTWKKRPHSESFRDYELVLMKTYFEALTSVRSADYTAAVEHVFNEYKDQVYTYTRDLIKDLKQQGYLLFALSGSHNEIIAKLADYYGFDDYYGTTFEQKSGHFTGKVDTPYGKKAEVLRQLVKRHGVNFAGSLAVGDSDSDTSMLELVDTPIAFNPEKTLYLKARANHWKIVIERKNMIYELEPQKEKNGTYVLAQTDG